MVSLSSSSVPHYYRYRHRSVRVSVYHGLFRKCLSYDVVYETYGWNTWSYRKLDRADKSQRHSKSYCQYPGLCTVLPTTEVEKVENIIFTFTHMFASEPRDGILGHQFNKRLESFAPCYSQFLLLAKSVKSPRNKKTGVYSFIAFLEQKFFKNEGRKTDNSSLRRPKFMPRDID